MARILVVDDDRDVLRVVRRCLSLDDHEVRTATNGREAFDGLDGVDLVITDIDMPEMDGFGLIVAIQDGDGAVPIIAMSGGGGSEVTLGRASALGAAATLEKPFGLEMLRSAIEAALSAGSGPSSG